MDYKQIIKCSKRNNENEEDNKIWQNDKSSRYKQENILTFNLTSVSS